MKSNGKALNMLICCCFILILDKKMLGSFDSQRRVIIKEHKSEVQFVFIACTI